MSSSPIVRVQQGALQGRLASSPDGRAFYSFQGIPYAKPPIGFLRFRDPQPPEPWEGVREATSEGNSCPQIDSYFHKKYLGDENCLFLNVFTPNLDGKVLPVMVFIHGGGFRFGSSSSHLYGADYLVEKDVVVVTINYRCGPLGFLCLNTPEVPGNAGLKDAVQALRWVKQNIQNFGGDSGNITIFGESCGGAMVSLLTASPLTKNMISKAIIQSGTALNPWAHQTDPIENAQGLAKELGCKSTNVDEILQFLTTTPVRDLIEGYSRFAPENSLKNGKNIFAPLVEKEFSGVEAFQTEAFIGVLTSGRVADVPVMIGTTTLEFAAGIDPEDLQLHVLRDLNIEPNSAEALAIVDRIKDLYNKGVPSSLHGMFHLYSDCMINIDTHRYLRYLINNSNKPIYYYKFDYVGELNISGLLISSLDFKHAGHMDELAYLFRNYYQKDMKFTPEDVKMRERMVRLWTNFAKYGNPTPDKNHYLNVTWLPVTNDNLYYLNLGNELALASNPDKEKMEYWDELYNKYYKIWDHPKTNESGVHQNNLISNVGIGVPDNVIGNQEVTPTAVHVVEQPEVNIQKFEGSSDKKPRPSNEIKMVQSNNVDPKDVVRANDPPEDDLPKNIGVNQFVNFFDSLGGKK